MQAQALQEVCLHPVPFWPQPLVLVLAQAFALDAAMVEESYDDDDQGLKMLHQKVVEHPSFWNEHAAVQQGVGLVHS